MNPLMIDDLISQDDSMQNFRPQPRRQKTIRPIKLNHLRLVPNCRLLRGQPNHLHIIRITSRKGRQIMRVVSLKLTLNNLDC